MMLLKNYDVIGVKIFYIFNFNLILIILSFIFKVFFRILIIEVRNEVFRFLDNLIYYFLYIKDLIYYSFIFLEF